MKGGKYTYKETDRLNMLLGCKNTLAMMFVSLLNVLKVLTVQCSQSWVVTASHLSVSASSHQSDLSQTSGQPGG